MRPAFTTLLYCLVTGHTFGNEALEIKLCWMIRIRLKYEDIVGCRTSLWHNEIKVHGRLYEEKYVKRVGLVTSKGVAIAVRVNDIDDFVARLRERAPHVNVQKHRDINRTMTIGRDRS